MILNWRLPSEKPVAGDIVLVEDLDGCYHIDNNIDNRFGEWGDWAIRWASLSKYMTKDNAQSEKKVREYYEDKIDDLKNIIYHNMADANDVSPYDSYNNLLAEIHSWLYGNNGKGRPQNVRSTDNTSRSGSDWDENDPPMPKPIPEEDHCKASGSFFKSFREDLEQYLDEHG